MSRITHAVPIDIALELLADPQRRTLLDELIDRKADAIRLDELVEHVAPENPPPTASGTSIGADQLLLETHHTHLPKLEDAGLVEYDAQTGTVRYRPDEHVEKLHRFVSAELDGWAY